MQFSNTHALNQVALVILDPAGRRKIAELVGDDEELDARLYLYREIGGQVDAGALPAEESQVLVDRLGFTRDEMRQLRTGELV